MSEKEKEAEKDVMDADNKLIEFDEEMQGIIKTAGLKKDDAENLVKFFNAFKSEKKDIIEPYKAKEEMYKMKL